MVKKEKPESEHLPAKPEAVGKAWGLRFYEQRPRKLKQIAAVLKLMAGGGKGLVAIGDGDSLAPAASSLTPIAPFPKRQKNGMLNRAEVVEWGRAHIVLAKDKRSFEINAKLKIKNEKLPTLTDSPQQTAATHSPSPIAPSLTGALPIQPDGGASGELFDPPGAQFEKTLDLWEDKLSNPDKWMEAPLQQWQMKQLEKHRPHLFHVESEPANDTPTFPVYCTQMLLCDYYKRRWPGHNINVYKQKIVHWQGGGGLPAGAPKHPTPDSAGRYKVAECFAWFERWLLPRYQKARTPELPGVPETEQVIDLISLKEQEERDQILFNQWERAKEKGLYVHRDVALATGVAAVKKIHQMVKVEDERNLPKQRGDRLLALGVGSDVVNQFLAWDVELARGITDRRETAMQQLAASLVAAPKKL